MALCKLKKQDTFQNALDKYNKTQNTQEKRNDFWIEMLYMVA
jgi:hypothetical protein